MMTKKSKRPARRPAKRPARRPARRPAKRPARRPAKRPAKRPARRPAKRTKPIGVVVKNQKKMVMVVDPRVLFYSKQRNNAANKLQTAMTEQQRLNIMNRLVSLDINASKRIFKA